MHRLYTAILTYYSQYLFDKCDFYQQIQKTVFLFLHFLKKYFGEKIGLYFINIRRIYL